MMIFRGPRMRSYCGCKRRVIRWGVGWVERSETHRKRGLALVGLAALDPPYILRIVQPFSKNVKPSKISRYYNQGQRYLLEINVLP